MKQEICKSIFTMAGFEILDMWELANQYWPKPDWNDDFIGREDRLHSAINYAKLRDESPWWLVKTKFGLIKIGWRKRVVEIDWLDTGIKAADITEDNTTKEDFYVHAWSELDAAKYLGSLKQILEKNYGN